MLVILAGLALTGCETGMAPEPVSAEASKGLGLLTGVWEIERLDAGPVAHDRMRLRIGADQSVTGNVVCNSLQGRVTGRLSEVRFTDVILTTAGCEVALSQRLTRLFEGTAAASLEGDRLTLRSEEGTWYFRRNAS